MSLFKKFNDPETVTQLLLKSVGIHFNIEEIAVKLEKHPEAVNHWRQQNQEKLRFLGQSLPGPKLSDLYQLTNLEYCLNKSI